MIITINSVSHTVDVLKSFNPVYKPPFKFTRSINGKWHGSDRGVQSDKFTSTVTIIGDIADINDIANDLHLETATATIDTQGARIFGSAVDYSSTFLAMISKPNNYNIRDLVTATISITIIPVAVPTYLSGVSATLPTLLYQWPVNRSVNDRNTPQRPIDEGNTYNTTLVDSGGVSVKSESSTVSFDMTNDEFAQLQKYVATNRLTPFTLVTDACLELFLNSTSTSVMITKFTFKPNGFDRWNASLTLVNNI